MLFLFIHTVVVTGLGLEGAEGLDLWHAASGVVRVTRTVLHRFLIQARVQVHHFSCKGREKKEDIYSHSEPVTKSHCNPQTQ